MPIFLRVTVGPLRQRPQNFNRLKEIVERYLLFESALKCKHDVPGSEPNVQNKQQ